MSRTSDYSDIGLTIQAPNQTAQSALSWQQAVVACSQGATCIAGTPIRVSLAVATEKQAGPLAADGSIVPVMDDTLVYVLAQSEVQCVEAGPSGFGTTVPPQPCTMLNFVDAESGKALWAVESAAVADPS